MFSVKKETSTASLATAKILPLRKRKSIVALDLEGDTLRVAQASGSGSSARITRLASVKLQIAPEKRDDATELGSAIKAALSSLRISPREAVLALPRAQVVLRPLEVPMVADIRELASLINFQISKDLPFRLEDATIDFKVLRQIESAPAEPAPEKPDQPAPAPEKRLEVLVGAVRSDVVEFYRNVSKTAGFKLAALGLRSVAAAFCASHCASTQSSSALLLVCVRQDETTIEVLANGKLVFSRAAAISVAPSAEQREAFLQAVEIEVVRSVHSFEGTTLHRPMEKLLVAGGTGFESAISELLAQRLNLSAQVLDPSACLEMKRAESNEAVSAIAPIGLALSALELGGLAIDFANPKKPAAPRNKEREQILIVAVAAITVLLVLFGVRMNLIKKRLKAKQEVQAQLTDAEKKLPIYRRGKSQTKVVNGWIAEDQNWLDHLAYLSAVLPGADEIFVTAFTVSPQHLIRFSVQARTGELLAELDKKLRAAGYEVRPLSITPANDKNGYNFRTTVELSIPKKLKLDLAKVKPPARPADDASLKAPRKST
jgi:Tfp pilus assembly PilM family ATPase